MLRGPRLHVVISLLYWGSAIDDAEVSYAEAMYYPRNMMYNNIMQALAETKIAWYYYLTHIDMKVRKTKRHALKGHTVTYHPLHFLLLNLC